MRNEILKLRAEGKTYNEICKTLGCSKSVISYHCGSGQKEKTRKRTQDRRKNTVIVQKAANFQYDKKKTKNKIDKFQNNIFGKKQKSFNWENVIDKFGWKTNCYLTGRSINLQEPKTYQFDHVIPSSRGGKLTLDNLGITCKQANMAKSDMTVEELLGMCIEILQHHGYKVTM